MNQLTFNKIAKYVQWGLEIAFVVVFISLCIAVGVKNKTIRTQKQEITKQELVIEQLTKNDTINR